MSPTFLRAADVAPQLGVTTGRVYQLIAAGLLPAVRMGRSIRIPGAAWDAWVAARVEEAAESVALTADGAVGLTTGGGE
jgi:excisionase family DNA binding protein